MKKGILLIAVLAMVALMGFSGNAFAQGSIIGQVIDADENPVAGAIVSLQGTERGRGQRPYMDRVETNERGVFEFAEVPVGMYVIAAMTRDLGGVREEVGVRDQQEVQLRLQLPGHCNDERPDRPEGTATVGGVVSDPDGQPVAGAHVLLNPMIRGRQLRPIPVETDENGVYMFVNIPAGRYVIMAGVREVGMVREIITLDEEEVLRLNLQLIVREPRERPGDGDGDGPQRLGNWRN